MEPTKSVTIETTVIRPYLDSETLESKKSVNPNSDTSQPNKITLISPRPTRADIFRSIYSKMKAFKQCFARFGNKAPLSFERARIVIELDPIGTVVSIKIESEYAKRELYQCLISGVQSLRVEPGTGENLQITFPLHVVYGLEGEVFKIFITKNDGALLQEE